MTELGEFAMFLAVGFTSLGLFFGPIGKAVANRIGGRQVSAGETTAEVEALRSQVAGLEPLASRVAELEERLDFAERLLARHAEPARIDGGQG
jgi:hypothetical protein